MKRIIALFKQEKGDALLLVSLSFMALVTITGLVIDGGTLYMNKAHLQKTANAAALSGAQELTSDDIQNVEVIVDKILGHHQETSSLKELLITLNDKVTVVLEKPVDLAFSSLFGIDTVHVEVDATASLGVMGRAIGAAPLGINENIPLSFGTEYKLKVDSSEVDTGNFGILALEGPGAKTYEDTLRNGFQDELEIGDVVNTQTGNIAGKTKKVVDELVNSCNDMNDRNCRRILLVPVYKPYNQQSNQLKQVEVTGFAFFYVLERMSNNDTSITGVFLERADTGFVDENAVNRGAYTIRLTE